jgi:hypothetical protein
MPDLSAKATEHPSNRADGVLLHGFFLGAAVTDHVSTDNLSRHLFLTQLQALPSCEAD